MKKIILISMFIALTLGSYAQRTLAVDTLQSNETVSFATMEAPKAIQAVCTQLGGTSDGTLSLFGSIDGTNWTYLNFNDHTIGVASPWASIVGGDSTSQSQITITSGLVASWILKTDLYPYVKIVGVGTSSDTTKVQIYWRK